MQSHHFVANRWGNNGNSERLKKKKKKKKLLKCIHLIVFQNIYVLLYNKYFQTKKKKKSDVAVSQTEMARYLR